MFCRATTMMMQERFIAECVWRMTVTCCMIYMICLIIFASMLTSMSKTLMVYISIAATGFGVLVICGTMAYMHLAFVKVICLLVFTKHLLPLFVSDTKTNTVCKDPFCRLFSRRCSVAASSGSRSNPRRDRSRTGL